MHNKIFCGDAEIIEKTKLSDDVYSLTVKCDIKPEYGQFVHIRVPGFTLRRPISICGYDEKNAAMRLVFQVRGEGTRVLSAFGVGDFVDIMAPLGRGFTLLPDAKKVILCGGGIGTPPMLALAEYYGSRAVAINGFATAGSIILNEDFKRFGSETVICTNDGSCGIKGFVTAALEEHIAQGADAVYACGPIPMLRAVAAVAQARNVFCEVSLEERMGCGVGACLVCTCAKNDGSSARVCKDGPVFNATEVDWEWLT